jgi:hypothetical protein
MLRPVIITDFHNSSQLCSSISITFQLAPDSLTILFCTLLCVHQVSERGHNGPVWAPRTSSRDYVSRDCFGQNSSTPGDVYDLPYHAWHFVSSLYPDIILRTLAAGSLCYRY